MLLQESIEILLRTKMSKIIAIIITFMATLYFISFQVFWDYHDQKLIKRLTWRHERMSTSSTVSLEEQTKDFEKL